MVDDGPVGLLAANRTGKLREVGQEVARHVRLDRLADRLEKPDRIVEEAAADDGVADPRDDLLLPRRAREVALAGCLADPGVGEGLLAVQVMQPGLDREAAGEAVFVVGRVAEGPRNVDVDATQRRPRPGRTRRG